jgi:hypothetical protein
VNRPLLNKKSRRADKGSPSRLVFGKGLTAPHGKYVTCYKQFTQAADLE